jgi:hypothetical protein
LYREGDWSQTPALIFLNGRVWGQPLRNYSVYPAPPPAGVPRVRIAEESELQPALETVQAVVAAQLHVLLAEPAAKVLLDRSAAENALEIVVTFSTAAEEVAEVKSDLIKAIHEALPVPPGKQVPA